MNIEILNIEPIVVDAIKNKSANAFAWMFSEAYRLGNDSKELNVIIEFYNKTINEKGENQVELVAISDLTIPASVLAVWLDDSVITNYIVTQIPSIVLIP